MVGMQRLAHLTEWATWQFKLQLQNGYYEKSYLSGGFYNRTLVPLIPSLVA